MSTDLIQRLRSLSHGFEEWRVESPVDGSYCMSYTRDEDLSPEQAARGWLADHLSRHPDSQFAGYIVRKHVVKTRKDQALDEAADALERLDGENATLRCALVEKVNAEAVLRELCLTDGGLFIGIEGGAAGLLADGFADILSRHESANYVELTFQARGQPIAVTVQHAGKPTPHMLRSKVEEENRALRVDAERYRWLRENEMLVWPSVDLANACHRAAHKGAPELIDAAIDAARKG